MASKSKRVKAREARIQKRELLLKKEQEELKDLGEAEQVEKEVDELEPVEKDMGMEDMYVGPTSFEELDAMEAAREQAMHMNEVTWQTQDLVRNILGHPMLDPGEKVAAMKKVSDGFGARMKSAMQDCEVKKDMDVLVIEAILAADKRHAGPLEFVGDLISKAVLTAKTENALSDEQFAIVRGEGENKVRKYPIHDKAHVRNDLARAAQMIDQGGTAAADARAALPKIRAAAKRMGIEMSVQKDIMIEKDLNGEWRYVGSPTNNFIDFDTDILAKEAHEEYAAWWEQNKEFSPVFTTWHLPEMVRKNAADLVMEHEGFLIVSGKLTEEEAEGLLKAKALTDLGMSHQSFALARDAKDPRIVTKYRMYEYSDLPLENACNPFTSNLDIVSKEADMDKAQYLAQFMGGNLEKAQKFLQTIGLKKEALSDAGIESKEKKEAQPETPPVEPPAVPAAPEKPATVDLQAIIKEVGDKFGMEDLSKVISTLQESAEKVPVLEALIKELMEKNTELQKSAEEKLAEMITPPAFSWMKKERASQDDKTVIKDGNKEDEKLKKSVPQVDWLSETLGVTPVQPS